MMEIKYCIGYRTRVPGVETPRPVLMVADDMAMAEVLQTVMGPMNADGDPFPIIVAETDIDFESLPIFPPEDSDMEILPVEEPPADPPAEEPTPEPDPA